MLRKCISAVLWQNQTVQSSMHQIFIHMCSPVSIEPSHMENPTRFSQAPSPQTTFPYILLQNLFLLLPNQVFLIRTLKTIEKQIHTLPYREKIPDWWAWTLTCYPLGHWCVLKLVHLKHLSNPCSNTLLSFHFSEAILHNFVPKFHTHSIEWHLLLI